MNAFTVRPDDEIERYNEEPLFEVVRPWSPFARDSLIDAWLKATDEVIKRPDDNELLPRLGDDKSLERINDNAYVLRAPSLDFFERIN